jgi:hypothetical protein
MQSNTQNSLHCLFYFEHAHASEQHIVTHEMICSASCLCRFPFLRKAFQREWGISILLQLCYRHVKIISKLCIVLVPSGNRYLRACTYDVTIECKQRIPVWQFVVRVTAARSTFWFLCRRNRVLCTRNLSGYKTIGTMYRSRSTQILHVNM